MPNQLNCRETSNGVVLGVHVAPGASSERIAGLYGDRLKIAVNAPPEKGKANKKLIELLAKTLAVKKNQISVVHGRTQRKKDILISDAKIEMIMKQILPYLE